MKEKMKKKLPSLKGMVIMVMIFASLFMGHIYIKGATTSFYDGYGLANDYGTNTASSGVLLSGELSDQPLYYNCHYMHNVLTWAIPDSWKLFQDNTGTWMNFYWDGDSTGYYLKNCWFRVNGNWFFAKSDGYLAKGWAFIPRGMENATTDCGWFYFDSNGVMQDGWQYVNNHWYYLNLSDVDGDSSSIYEWGECLHDTSAVPDLNTVADSSLTSRGKTARYVTGFSYTVDIYAENDGGGYTLESSTPKTCNLGSNSTCQVTEEAPAKTGHTLNTQVSSPSAVTNSLSLVKSGNLASTLSKVNIAWFYNRNTYTLSLNANGGTVPTNSVTLKYLTSAYYDMSGNIPARSGYAFNGWYTKTSGGTKVYGADGKVTNEGTYWSNNKNIYAGDYSLYAQWSAKPYTVTYNANGGSLTSGSSTASVAYGGAVSLSPKASKDGLLFAGWGLSPTDTKPLSSYKMPAKNVTLYALYSLPVSDMKEAVLVSWSVKNPDVYNSFPMTLTKTSNGEYTYSLSGIDLKKGLTYSSDYDIDWGIVLYDNAGNSRKLKGDPPVPELYLQTVNHYIWNVETDSWVFYASTSELAPENSTYTPAYLDAVPSGYYKDTIDATYKVTGVTTSSAYYKPYAYTLYFDANGGSCDTASKQVYKDYFYGELPIPTREGYSFAGWYTEPQNGSLISSSDRYTKAEDSTVYAHWKINTHNVIYDYMTNGGDGVDLQVKETNYGSAVDLSLQAYKNGWEFVGWNTDPNAVKAASSSSTWTCESCQKTHSLSSLPDHDIVLYAIYKKDIDVTVYEMTDLGQAERTLSKTIYNNEAEASFTMKEVNTWTGWTFLGWTTDTGAEKEPVVGIDSELRANKSTTLYGLYTSTVTLQYDTNGSSMVIDDQTKDCFYNASGDSSYPSFTIADGPILSDHSFVKWQDSEGNGYMPEESITFAKDTLLTATWDKYPEIEAYDRYFTLEEAVNGNVTETELLEKVTGTDLEDGTLVNGIIEDGKGVIVKNYNASDFTSLTAEKEFEITYQATDSFGNVVTKTVTVTVTDTSMRKSMKKSYVRFISDKFFTDNDGNLVAASEGGLEETSVWKTDSSRFKLLQRTLYDDKTDVEIWIFKQEDIKELKKDL